jgi:lambda family phage minor tail protein L
MPYRVGDIVKGNVNVGNAEIIAVKGSVVVTNNSDFNANLVIGEKLYIVNEDADPDSFVKDTFKVDSLSSLNETTATFAMTSWLQFFKLKLPKRRYLKNTCPWVYKGEECQYPESGSGTIPGTTLSANGFFDVNNQEVFTKAEDECAHDLTACERRRNGIHFGGFPGTGRTIPR